MKAKRKTRWRRISLFVLGIGGFILTWNTNHATDFGYSILLLTFIIFIVTTIFWNNRFRKIGTIIPLSYFLLVLITGIIVCFQLNEAQSQFIWIDVSYLILPFSSLQMFLMHFLQRILGNTDDMVINFVIAPAISFIIIGWPFYYLLSKGIELIWGIGRFRYGYKPPQENADEKDLKVTQFFSQTKSLFIGSILSFAFLIYLLVSFHQWDEFNIKGNIYFANFRANKDFQEKRLRVLRLGPGKAPYFSGKKIGALEIWVEPWQWYKKISIPYYIDKKRYVQFYNDEMFRLTTVPGKGITQEKK